ncbi:MAG: ATP-binding cassette domain-containing protein, partial [Proteobacteria bacterium]|nr:ATP-binding cassette domain-containing protein [Pseudomonadota bacterium]
VDLPYGQFVSVFGPNGCGKSTLINMISGLMPMDEGQVRYDGQTINDTNISYVFQNYREALFPWLRSIDNIHYPLKVMGMGKQERTERVEKLLADFEVKIDLNAYPYTLSGGQQQTVSILRALVTEPEILFLDEPFSALDYEMTLFMREQIQKIYMKTGTTTLLVSHDLEEAIQLADKVMLLTQRPTSVAEFVDVDLTWPRTTQVTTDQRFVDLKRHCLDVFWREVKAP